MRGKQVLVTGADGFLGSHLVERLVLDGAKVRAFVFYNSFSSWGWLEQIPKHIRNELEIFPGDIRDSHGVREAMKGCEVVYHLAALISIPFSYHSPDAYVETNIRGTLNVVQAARDLGVARVVHTSTSEVYGTAEFVPITEAHPLKGQSPYSASKIGADQIALSFYSSFDTPVAVIRPFNTYGPRQSARAVIPTVITQIVAGLKCISLGALEPTRDFNFVDDMVQGFLAVAKHDEANGEVFNIGSNFEISIGDTAELIAQVMQAKVEIVCADERLRPKKSEVLRLWADNTKAQQVLGWKPLYAGKDGLRRGLAKTVEWFQDPHNMSGYKPYVYNV